MRADRLLSILLLLQNHGKLTTRTLAAKLEVSERTINRDMEALSAAGVPVYAERGAAGGWCLSDAYRMNLTGMKAEEILTLLISSHANLLGDLGIKQHFDTAIQKLLAASPTPTWRNAEAVRQKIHIDGAGWHQTHEPLPFLSIVQEAVWAQRVLSIAYQRDAGVVERVVHPLGLVAKRSVWYLVSDVAGDLRTYRISRLVDAGMLEESFEPRADFNLAEYWEQSKRQFMAALPRYPAKLRLSGKMIDRLARERYVKILHSEPSEDGWVTADVEFEELVSACEIILSCGPSAEVLAPTELRNKVLAEVEAILRIYE